MKVLFKGVLRAESIFHACLRRFLEYYLSINFKSIIDATINLWQYGVPYEILFSFLDFKTSTLALDNNFKK